MATLVHEVISLMWLYNLYRSLLIGVCVKKKEIMKKNLKKLKMKKVIYIFHCIILLGVRVWT